MHYGVAVAASSEQAILDRGGVAQLLHQEEAEHKQQENDDEADQTRGLPVFGPILLRFVEPRPMLVQTVLL
jgi:hypothetical protein